jgi:hypothetical protein
MIRFEVWDRMWELRMARLPERGVQTAKRGRHSDGEGLYLVGHKIHVYHRLPQGGIMNR